MTVETARQKLAEIRKEQERQMQWAGVRLGVFVRLRELARDARRYERIIECAELERQGV